MQNNQTTSDNMDDLTIGSFDKLIGAIEKLGETTLLDVLISIGPIIASMVALFILFYERRLDRKDMVQKSHIQLKYYLKALKISLLEESVTGVQNNINLIKKVLIDKDMVASINADMLVKLNELVVSSDDYLKYKKLNDEHEVNIQKLFYVSPNMGIGSKGYMEFTKRREEQINNNKKCGIASSKIETIIDELLPKLNS